MAGFQIYLINPATQKMAELAGLARIVMCMSKIIIIKFMVGHTHFRLEDAWRLRAKLIVVSKLLGWLTE